MTAAQRGVSPDGQIRVLVVDDSPSMRLLLQQMINREQDMRVVGTAPDPHAARELIKQLRPDLITLDVEMPGMNGLEFLDRLMRLHPMPVLMISSLTAEGSEQSLRALELGAVDIIRKRALTPKSEFLAMAAEVADKIRAAYQAVPHFRRRAPLRQVSARPLVHAGARFDRRKVVVVGASTGGTEAIKDFLEVMPPGCPPILLTQHMPEDFTFRFAKRLNDCCAIRVKEAEAGERLQPGWAYIAPGHSHMLVRRVTGGGYETVLSQGPEVNLHRPAVDVLFDSAAEAVGRHAVGVLLTGMGKDGAAGLLRLRESGATTFTQDEASCVVFGMPRAARELGASCAEGPPARLADLALAALRDRPEEVS
ncbi:chemotaxis response regulator protein-glutamate methylesterase [Amnimonas aquatica]|uniref:Protein-glutamate methylesterase/protein-glutamine glutaminase n=2 Tax=Amnimonas aquatica TaxID=2094561 RepID=A0A2P6AUD6_9GAMM|nr:chemotaxis response regulator protein-glutamate methylesterase [Amnimonas aquatica]